MINRFLNHFTQDVAIDLGTANTLVAVAGSGIVINEPSVVAVNQETRQVLAVGGEAQEMLGRTPAHVTAIRPLKDGVVSDFETTEAMIRYFIRKVTREYAKWWQLGQPRVVIGVPSLVTEVEVRAVIDAARSAGARRAYVIEEPIAAAIGADLQIEKARGALVVDIGGGTTDIALISMGSIVSDQTISVAGDEMNQAIVDYVRSKYNLEIGDRQASEIKHKLGSASPLRKVASQGVSGRDIVKGLPKTVKLSSVEVTEALQTELKYIRDSVGQVMHNAPAELISDIASEGIWLAGGGANIQGLDKFFTDEFKVKVNVISDPDQAVIRGLFKLLGNLDLLAKVEVKETRFY